MVDYEHEDGQPQHAVLSWLDDEATDLPEVGTYLVRLSDFEAREAELVRYREALQQEWEANHAEHCRDEFPCTAGELCCWPLPSVLAGEDT